MLSLLVFTQLYWASSPSPISIERQSHSSIDNAATDRSSALYANKINTLFFHDLNHGLYFGFADGQVTPFEITTPDGQTLYAWHVLPLDVYARHERKLRTGERHKTPLADFAKTLQFQLLSSSADPPARVVISCRSSL